MNNVLLIFGAVLVAILSVLVAAPLVVDWNSYRGVFEEEASRILGRDVRVGGSVAARFLPSPIVRFEKVRIADTAATGGDPLFRAESLTMRLSIGALLRGALEAENVELKRPALRLAVDGDGRGNWRTLSVTPGSLPFMPADVRLRAVTMRGGQLTLVGPSGREAVVVSDIDGELAVDGAAGPFRFKGTTRWQGEVRDLRLATGTVDARGVLDLRGTVRVVETGATYSFDGRASDLLDRPRIEGDLTAKLPVGNGAGTAAGAQPVPVTGSPGGGPPKEAVPGGYDLKAQVAVDGAGGRLRDLTLASDDVKDPQLVTGEATAVWGAAPRLDITLASRSLSLDRLAGTSATGPLDAVRTALGMAMGALPTDVDTDARVRADRVVLAGEPVTGVRLHIARKGGALTVQELRAELPGATRIEASGTIGKEPRTLAFTGPIRMRGANMGRLVSWATRVPGAGEASARRVRYDGAFGLTGDLAMSGTVVALTAATADFGETPITGSIRVSNDGRRRIAVTLDGRRLDLGLLWPDGLDVTQLRALLGGAAPAVRPGRATGAALAGLYALDPARSDIEIAIRADELRTDGGLDVRDVDAAFRVERGKLGIERLRLTTPAGLGVDVTGHLAGLPEPPSSSPLPVAAATPGPRTGLLNWVVTVPSETAATDLMAGLDVPADLRPTSADLAALGPARLAGATTLGARGAASLDVTFDGTVGGGRVVGTARLDEGLAGWRTAPVAVQATIESADVGRWLDLAGLRPGPRAGGNGQARSARGTLVWKAEGRAAAGLATYAALQAPATTATYRGTVTLPAGATPRLDGTATIAATDPGDLVALAGLPATAATDRAKLAGDLRFALADGTLRLAATDFAVGPATVDGTATIAVGPARGAGAAPREITAKLSADKLDLAVLARLLSGGGATGPRTGDDRSAWPADPLTLDALDGIAGRVELDVGRVLVDGSPWLSGVQSVVALAPGRLTVERIEGAAAGGRLDAKLTLERIAGGGALTLDGALDGLDLARFRPGVTAEARIAASLTGQGISLRGIVAALRGRGEVAVGTGRIQGVAPSAVAAVADRAIEAREPVAAGVVPRQLEQALEASTMAVDARTLTVLVSEGIARVQSPVLTDASGQAKLDLSIDLPGQRFSSLWEIEARTRPTPLGRAKPPLPPVVIRTIGALTTADDVESQVVLGAFEQEVSLRRIERDAEELERLRKLAEEQRARAEAERIAQERAALERLAAERQAAERLAAERAAAAAAAAAEAQAARAAAAGQPPPVPPQGTPLGTGAPLPRGAVVPDIPTAGPAAGPPPGFRPDGTPIGSPPIGGAAIGGGPVPGPVATSPSGLAGPGRPPPSLPLFDGQPPPPTAAPPVAATPRPQPRRPRDDPFPDLFRQ